LSRIASSEPTMSMNMIETNLRSVRLGGAGVIGASAGMRAPQRMQ
jgi:hypothetical protein